MERGSGDTRVRIETTTRYDEKRLVHCNFGWEAGNVPFVNKYSYNGYYFSEVFYARKNPSASIEKELRRAKEGTIDFFRYNLQILTNIAPKR